MEILKARPELFRNRCSIVMCWIWLHHTILTWLILKLLDVEFATPTSWIDFFEDLVLFNFWAYSSLSALFVALFVVFHFYSCTVIPEVRLRRWDSTFNVFLSPTNLVSIFGHTVLGGLTARCYLGLVEDHSISGLTSGKGRKSCFCDIHFFVVLFGALSGFLFACIYFAKCKHLLKFTALQQSRFMQAKAMLAPLMLTNLSTTMKQMVFFYIPFLIIGFYSRPIVVDVLNVPNSCTEPLDSIAGVISLRLFWTTIVTSFALHYTWDASTYLVNIFLTKAYTFPEENLLNEDETVPLHVAMATPSDSFTQYLAYLDFYLLSQSSCRRRFLFELSHPGGHPYNWKCVINECLGLLHQLTNHLNSAGEPLKSAAEDKAYYRQESSEANVIKYLKGTSSAQIHQQEHPGLTLLPPHRVAPAIIIKLWVVRKVRQMFAAVKSWYTAFINRRNQLSRQYLFLGCQPHIWAAEGISFLAVASLTEDSYGVVQPDLPDIVTILCDLQQCLEKQVKWLPQKSVQDPSLQLDKRLKMGLNAAVKSALYRLATKFQDHLSSLAVSSECQRILQQYASYSK